MTGAAGHRRAVLFASLLAVAVTADARGAFEMLPGPIPGGVADWAWDPLGCADEAAGWRVGAVVGRPAAIDGLLWSRATAAWRRRSFGASVELDQLRLESIYSETVYGGWLAAKGLEVGVRRWERRTIGVLDAAGWSLTTAIDLRWRSWRVALAGADRALGPCARGGPQERWGIRARWRPAPGLETSAGASLDGGDATYGGGLRWRLLDEFALEQRVRWPGFTLTSGLTARVRRVGVGLWYEPNPSLGARVGISCGLL